MRDIAAETGLRLVTKLIADIIAPRERREKRSTVMLTVLCRLLLNKIPNNSLAKIAKNLLDAKQNFYLF
ncbi:MAG: hypothetical protein U0264_02960 [Candidatus Kapaibacterium sp.]